MPRRRVSSGLVSRRRAFRGASVKDQKITINDRKITEYRVRLKVTFILND
ncbi:dodecin domain-containing protein [Ahrensia sp. R2A130]